MLGNGSDRHAAGMNSLVPSVAVSLRWWTKKPAPIDTGRCNTATPLVIPEAGDAESNDDPTACACSRTIRPRTWNVRTDKRLRLADGRTGQRRAWSTAAGGVHWLWLGDCGTTRPLIRTRKAFGWFRSDYSKLTKTFSSSGLSSTVRAVTLRRRPSRSNLVNARVTVSAEVPR
jgi:hypothetical protein